MASDLIKAVPHSIVSDKIPQSDRQELAKLYLYELRSRHVMVPVQPFFWLGVLAFLAIVNSVLDGVKFPMPSEILLLLIFSALLSLYIFVRGRFFLELSDSFRGELAQELVEKGYKQQVDDIRYARE